MEDLGPVNIDFMLGGNMETESAKVEKSMDNITESAKRAQTQIGGMAAKSGTNMNGLNMSVQQVVRELPSATMGLNMFFLAISNNLPILADNIKRVKAENELLKASGEKTTPVFKQVIGSIFSWQSALMIGITLLTVFGKDLLSLVEKLFTGKNAIDKTTESQKALNKVFSDFTGSAMRKIESVTRIGIEIQKYGNNSENAKKIVDDFNKTFNTHLTTIDQVKAAYPGLSAAAIDAAVKIQAANSLIEKSAKALMKKQEADTKLAPYSKKQITEQEQMIDRLVEFAKKRNYNLDELTTDLISGQRTGLLGFDESLQMVQHSGEPIKKEFNDLKDFFSKPENLWFASMIAQQRKSTKQLEIYNKETMQLLKGVQFNDFSSGSATPEKEQFDKEKAFQSEILNLRNQTSKILIDQQQDSLQKRLSEIELEKDLEIQKIREKEVAIIEAYNKAHKGEKGFTGLSTKPEDIKNSLSTIDPVQAKTLNDEELKLIDAYGAKKVAATKKWNDELNKLAAKYGDEREKIEAEYEERIQKLRDAKRFDEASALEDERDKKISAISTRLIKETDLYKIASEKQLLISKELTAALISELEKRIQADETITSEDADKMLTKLHQADYTVRKTDNPFSDLIDGLAKYKAAREEQSKTNATTDIENFAKLEDAANKAQRATMEAAAGALQGVGDVLNSAINGLDKLGLLSEQDKKDAGEILGMIDGAANLAMGIATGNLIQIIQGPIDLLVNGIEFFDFENKKLERDQQKHLDNVKELEKSYQKLERAVSKALGTEKYKLQRDQIATNNKMIAENEAWLADEYKKKKGKQNADEIAAREKAIEDLKQQNEDLVDSTVETLTGKSVMSAIDEFANAYVDAWASGTDAAAKSAEMVKNILKSSLVEFIKGELQPEVTDLMNTIRDAWADGVLTDAELALIDQKRKEADAKANKNKTLFDKLGLNDATTATGIQGQIKNMTEETGSAVVGQFTAMRLDINKLLTEYKNSGDVLAKQLAVQQEIADNTAFCRKLERMDNNLELFRLNGIKVQ